MIYRGALAVKSKPCATADSATQQQDLLRNSRYCYGTTDTATLVRNISRQFESRIEQSMQRRNVGFVVYVDLFCDIDGHVGGGGVGDACWLGPHTSRYQMLARANTCNSAGNFVYYKFPCAMSVTPVISF